jgi:Zn-dependent peptidase ImmA (M78 family)
MALYDSAVSTAVEILDTYNVKFPSEAFPTIKGKLLPLIEARAAVRGIDNIYVKRFKEEMRPIVGQMRRISESNGVYQPVEEHGIVYLCPTLDLPWQRFIQVKEMAHLLLDDPADYVHSATDIDRLMVCLAQFGAQSVTQHYASEQRALVCAIELLFPKKARDELMPRYNDAKITPDAVAKAARIPIDYVKLAMGETYQELIRTCHAKVEIYRVA